MNKQLFDLTDWKFQGTREGVWKQLSTKEDIIRHSLIYVSIESGMYDKTIRGFQIMCQLTHILITLNYKASNWVPLLNVKKISYQQGSYKN